VHSEPEDSGIHRSPKEGATGGAPVAAVDPAEGKNSAPEDLGIHIPPKDLQQAAESGFDDDDGQASSSESEPERPEEAGMPLFGFKAHCMHTVCK
jgi:hypothetical protein